jgi:hypothetical protein
MIDTLNMTLIRLFELRVRLARSLSSDRGQTTAEYVAIMAVGVTLALGVLWVTLKDPLTNAIEAIACSIDETSCPPPSAP